jgi:hypothetical protein
MVVNDLRGEFTIIPAEKGQGKGTVARITFTVRPGER